MQATLYDESFNEIDFAGSYSDRPLTQYLDEGRYYITVSGYSFDIYGKYTLQLSKWEVPITTLIDYTYTTLPAFGTEISDSIHGALPALVNYGNDNGRYVQGYKFQGAKDKIMTLDITSGPVTNPGEYDKGNINLIIWLLNSKFEKVQEFDPDPYYTATEYSLLREDSTYYLVFMPRNIKDEGSFSFSVTLEELKDYYISADAEGTGLSPESPAASINEILLEADGPGRYHLMSDLDLSALMGSYIHTGYVLPYDRDVKITFTPDPDISYEIFDILEGDITLGSSEHKIIFENIPLNEIDVPFGTSILKYNFYAKIENVEIRNCSMENILSGYSGEIILKNVTLAYDTLESIARNSTNYTMTGCNISNNLIEDGLATAYSSNFYSTTYTQNNEEQLHIENCTVKNNIFSQPAIMSLGVDLTIRQSEISDNSLDVDEDVLAEFASTGLTEDNLAGIFIASAELNIDGSFKMDTANYVVLLDTNSYVNITEPVTALTAMTIIPLDLSLGIPSLFYFEGRKVIGGDEDLVSANYKHFRLAQRGETPWYIQANGRIYTTSGIEDVQRDNATAVFPNPASSAVMVNGLECGDNVRLMDINGRVVVNRQTTGNSMNINLSSLNSGIYFVQVVDGDKVVTTTKLIKK